MNWTIGVMLLIGLIGSHVAAYFRGRQAGLQWAIDRFPELRELRSNAARTKP